MSGGGCVTSPLPPAAAVRAAAANLTVSIGEYGTPLGCEETYARSMLIAAWPHIVAAFTADRPAASSVGSVPNPTEGEE